LAFESLDLRAQPPQLSGHLSDAAMYDLANAKKILIIRLSSIGDVLQAATVARAIKSFYPQTRISWAVETKSKDVILDNVHLERVFVWPRKEWNAEAKKTLNPFTFFKRNLQFLSQIRKQNFDIAIDLHGMYRSDLISYASRAKIRICLPKPHEPCLGANVKTKNKNFSNRYERYFSVLTHFGIEGAEPVLEMFLRAEDEEFARDFMAEHGLKPQKFIVFNPSSNDKNRCWPAESYARLGDLLAAKYGLPIVVFGAAADKHLAQSIASRMAGRVIDATGTMTLKQLGAAAKQACVFISGDTGPLFIAQGLQVPTVALFGASSALECHINGPDRIALQAENGSLGNLSAPDVFRAVESLISRFSPP